MGSSIRTKLTDQGVVVVDDIGAAVVPGILVAEGRAFRLVNKTRKGIDVFVTGNAPSVVSIPAGGKKVIAVDAQPGVYPFAVFSHEAGDFARGNSSPRIIIQ
jgi:hypothetical protein